MISPQDFVQDRSFTNLFPIFKTLAMKLYFFVFLYELKKYFVYPLELIFTVLQYFLKLLFLIVFWTVISKSSENNIDIRQLASYFLIAEAVSLITMAYTWDLGRFVRHKIRDGSISNFFIKPVSLLKYCYFSTIGGNGVEYVLALFSIVIALLIVPPASLLGVFSFFIFLILASIIGFSFNLFEASLSFVFTETNGIKNAVRHVISVFSGLLVPLYLFPEGLRKIVELTPFPAMIFSPVNALSYTEINDELIKSLLVAIFWAILLLCLMMIFWKRVIKYYEAVGL